MIYHIFKGAPQIANPKIKEILWFYKRFGKNPHGARTPATERGGERVREMYAPAFCIKTKGKLTFLHSDTQGSGHQEEASN